MSKNIKKYQKWVLDCYDVKNSQKRWGSCVLKKKQSKKVKKHITINDENIKKMTKILAVGYNLLPTKREGTNCPPPYKNIILIRWFLSLVDVL